MSKKIVLTDCKISLDEFMQIVKKEAILEFSEEMVEKIKKSRQMIDHFLEENRAIYGVTTGFGENVRYVIKPDDAVQLQKNIVRSHSVSVGEPLPEEQVRAIMLMQILNTGKGLSGIKLDTIILIKDFLNAEIYPFAPGDGSVGYLAVEGHIALTYMGEGYVWEDGKKVESFPVLEKKGLKPVEFACKEGLSLLNGSTSVTAMGLLAVNEMKIAVKNLDVVGAMVFEALQGTVKSLDERLHIAKNHAEEIESAKIIREMLADSEICEKYLNVRVQDPYVLRSMAHILGAAKKIVLEAEEVIVDEMHGVSDNPELFETEDGGVALMCGNFDGSYVGSHADMLGMAAAMVGNLAERCVDRMVNRYLNNDLPAFLAPNPGLNNGFMIPQYTAAGLLNEMKVLATSCSIDSIPTCAEQESPVSFAYFAGKKAIDIAKKLQYIIGIEFMVAAQAIELQKPLKSSTATAKVQERIRDEVAFADEDRYFYPDIEALYKMVHEEALIF